MSNRLHRPPLRPIQGGGSPPTMPPQVPTELPPEAVARNQAALQVLKTLRDAEQLSALLVAAEDEREKASKAAKAWRFSAGNPEVSVHTLRMESLALLQDALVTAIHATHTMAAFQKKTFIEQLDALYRVPVLTVVE